MITASQLRAVRALLGIDQRELATLSGLSLPTIQRMEASGGVIRGNVDSLMRLVSAIEAAGIELIAEGAQSSGAGRGVRLKIPETPHSTKEQYREVHPIVRGARGHDQKSTGKN